MKYSETFTYPPVREKTVLAYATGGELSIGVVLESSLGEDFTLTEPMTGKSISGKRYQAGQLIARIENTNHGGKVGRYAKYDPSATDGRGNTDGVAPSSIGVLKKDQAVTFGDVPAGTFKAFCAFDTAQLIGYSGNETILYPLSLGAVGKTGENNTRNSWGDLSYEPNNNL